MVKSKRTIDDVDTYESDGGFVSNDDGKMKAKGPKGGKRAKTTDNSGSSKFWSLSNGKNPRRVEISDFKGQKLINIREYYEKDDVYLPGKKGISLSLDQYKSLLKAIPEINTNLKHTGLDLSKTAADDSDDEEDGPEAKVKPQNKLKAKKSKANIEATSDEDDED